MGISATLSWETASHPLRGTEGSGSGATFIPESVVFAIQVGSININYLHFLSQSLVHPASVRTNII